MDINIAINGFLCLEELSKRSEELSDDYNQALESINKFENEFKTFVEAKKSEIHQIKQDIESKIDKTWQRIEQEMETEDEALLTSSAIKNFNSKQFKIKFDVVANPDVIKNSIQVNSSIIEQKLTVENEKDHSLKMPSDQDENANSIVIQSPTTTQNTSSSSATTSVEDGKNSLKSFLPYKIPTHQFKSHEKINVTVVGFDDSGIRFIDKDIEKLRDFDKFDSELQNHYNVKINQKVLRDAHVDHIGVVNDTTKSWSRCIVTSIVTQINGYRSFADVFLIDHGLKLRIFCNQFYCLDRKFKNMPQNVSSLTLADIEIDEDKFGEVQDLVEVYMKSDLSVEAHLTDSSRSAYFYVSNQECRVNFNLLLVKLGLATITGSQIKNDLITHKSTNKTKEIYTEIKILHVAGVDEFYAIRYDQIGEYQKLYESIKYSDLEFRPAIQWKKGQFCTVDYIDEDSDRPNIYRGKISEVNQENLKVFLIDIGKTIKVSANYEMIYAIENSLLSLPPALKLQMHNSESLSNLTKANRVFQSICEGAADDEVFAYFAEVPAKSESLTIEKLKILHESGVFKIVKVKGNELCVENEDAPSELSSHVQKFNSCNSTLNCQLIFMKDHVIDIVPAKISHWLHHKSEMNFEGRVTHIESNGTFYILSTKNDELAAKLTKELKTAYRNAGPSQIKFRGNLPVVFKCDKNFFRGILKSSLINHYEVQSIDFGFVDKVEKQNVFDDIVASRVPALCGRYQLMNFNPQVFFNKFSSIKETILFNNLSVKVLKSDSINTCNMTYENYGDLVNYLEVGKDVSVAVERKNFFNRKLLNVDEQQNIKEKAEMEYLDQVAKSFAHLCPQLAQNYDEDNSLDVPLESGPKRLRRRFKTKRIWNFELLNHGKEEFTFEPIAKTPEGIIYVKTDFKELKQSTKLLMTRLDNIKMDDLELVKTRNFARRHCCLVNYHGECWMRGEIHQSNSTHATVFMVDHGGFENFPKSDLYEITEELCEAPCALVMVKLKNEGIDVFQMIQESRTKLMAKVDFYWFDVPIVEVSQVSE